MYAMVKARADRRLGPGLHPNPVDCGAGASILSPAPGSYEEAPAKGAEMREVELWRMQKAHRQLQDQWVYLIEGCGC